MINLKSKTYPESRKIPKIARHWYDSIPLFFLRRLWILSYQFTVLINYMWIQNSITLQTLCYRELICKTRQNPGPISIPKFARHLNDSITLHVVRHLRTLRYLFTVLYKMVQNCITLEISWWRALICKRRQIQHQKHTKICRSLIWQYNIA